MEFVCAGDRSESERTAFQFVVRDFHMRNYEYGVVCVNTFVSLLLLCL